MIGFPGFPSQSCLAVSEKTQKTGRVLHVRQCHADVTGSKLSVFSWTASYLSLLVPSSCANKVLLLR